MLHTKYAYAKHEKTAEPTALQQTGDASLQIRAPLSCRYNGTLFRGRPESGFILSKGGTERLTSGGTIMFLESIEYHEYL
jgi:hypothetical protein